MGKRTLASVPRGQTIDLNLLPERYRRRRLSFRGLRPWILTIGFSLMLVPSFKLLGQASANLKPLQEDSRQTLAELAGFREVSEERQALQKDYEDLISQTAQIEADYQSISIQQVLWGPMLKTVVGLVPGGVRLTSISQSVDEVTLEGEADSYMLPLDYADRLREGGQFSDVIVDSLRRLAPSNSTDGSTVEPQPAQGFSFEIRLLLQETASP
ncbi:MAG TPA: PilN domain-containing protein [Anaerolineales bacterium]|nr:PilN domain-containing protein [Anaerolineales bacterium]